MSVAPRESDIFKSMVDLRRGSQLLNPVAAVAKVSDVANTYLLLRSQALRITEVMETMLPTEEPLKQVCDKLLKCKYSELLDTINSTIAWVSANMSTNAKQILTAVLTLNKHLHTVHILSEEKSEQLAERDATIHPKDQFGNNVCIVCRICEENIPIHDIDNHTRLCAEEYKNVSLVTGIHDQLEKIKAKIMHGRLESEWPGLESIACADILPLLQFVLLIDRAVALDVSEREASDKLAIIYTVLKNTRIFRQEASQIIPLVKQKQRVAHAWRKSNVPLFRRNTLKPAKKQFRISDFKFIDQISKGAYARVFLAQNEKTDDIFAIKAIPKSSLREGNQAKRILGEKDILLQLGSPYIVNFYYSIIGETNLYLVMEYLPGGDLCSLLHELGSIDESVAKVYVFQIVMALKYLREHGIIHRDLKPDNILIAKNGGVKLTDFGLSYMGMLSRDGGVVKSNSLVGTPNYVAPEIIMSQVHSFPVDLWSLGVITYELLFGEMPFDGDTKEDLRQAILSGKYEFVDDGEELVVSPEAKDFIAKLLVLKPEDRLGARSIKELLEHPWFADLDPNNLQVPFKPEPKSKLSTEYFKKDSYDMYNDKDILSDMMASKREAIESIPFEAVAVDQLARVNLNAAKKMRKRRISDCTTASSDDIFAQHDGRRRIPLAASAPNRSNLVSRSPTFDYLPPLLQEDECNSPLHNSEET